jgi:methionine-rich copper-binding protein CopC
MKLQHHSLILALAVMALVTVAISAQPASAEEPEITFQFPLEGDVLKERPLVLQMCFKEPVLVLDLPPLDVGDFKFALIPPASSGGLGMRIVFQPDGYGVAIYPGNPASELQEGEWKWEYRLVDAASGDPIEGTVRFTTNAATGEEILQPTPPACLAQGATQHATVPSGGTEETPTATPDSGNSGDGDGDLSVLELALITVGIAAAAAIVGVLAFFFRKRVGYEPHAPSDDSSDSTDDHH